MVEKVFWEGLEFKVPQGVYVPREDSYISAEALVGQELGSKKVLDMGAGSGFLAVIASSEGAEVGAVDINPKAVEAARENAERNNCSIDAFQSDMFEEVSSLYDLMIFNIPYLPEDSEEIDEAEERAWKGGEGGREVLDRFIDSAPGFLNEEGEILITQIESNGVDRTISHFQDKSFEAKVLKTEKIPWQELVVIKASKI